MVRKGLPKGAVFEDGGRKYVVLKVNADGTYISSADPEKVSAADRKEEPRKRGGK